MQLRALTPIRHDGADYAEGDLLEVAQAPGEALLALGAAASADPTPPAEPKRRSGRSGKSEATSG